MKRSLFVAIAGLAASGCYSSSNTSYVAYGALNVYWDFQRNVVPPQTAPAMYSCAQGAVDYVVVTDGAGFLLDPATPTIACGDPNRGATISGLPSGGLTVRVRGYRGTPGSGILVFDGEQPASIPVNATGTVMVVATGVQANLDLFAYLYSTLTSPPSLYSSCAAATVDTVTYTLVDGAGTTVDSANNIICAGTLPLLFFSGTVDLDNYVVRAAAYQGATHFFDSCSVPFDHFGTQTGGSGVAVALDNPIPAVCP